ncbi:hypothetical protein MG293_010451 [Ovis ammon polii]|uniref:Uncharacterized protein n=1 Tax=Ovis ammon polii TaxID=230172 RepID=A0AAD4U787_OVIAM|nr:hypothetical protein MG293_010451 [Ovis ammon polii]
MGLGVDPAAPRPIILETAPQMQRQFQLKQRGQGRLAGRGPRLVWMWALTLDTQDETSRPCSVGHMDGDANDDTLFSGEMPGAVRASCVILMEPHEALMSSCLLRQQLQADSTASGHTLLILLKELLSLTKRRLLRHEQASTPAQQEKSAQFSVPVQASSRAAGMEQRCLL